jgi:dsRNA-specific ribonuclease
VGRVEATGTGQSKKNAEQMAAESALALLPATADA